MRSAETSLTASGWPVMIAEPFYISAMGGNEQKLAQMKRIQTGNADDSCSRGFLKGKNHRGTLAPANNAVKKDA